MADDYPDNLGTRGHIPYNGPGVTANIETPGDVDWFGFNDEFPNRFHITNATFQFVRIQVVNFNGAIAAEYYGPAAGAYLDFTAPPEEFPGMNIFFVAVTGFTSTGEPATGSYMLNSAAVNDDHPDVHTGQTAGVNIDGAAATGVINFNGDWDVFHINNPVAESVTIDVTSADFAWVIIRAMGASGNTIASYSGLVSGATIISPPGAAYVSIIGFDAAGNFTTGGYSFTVTSIPDDHGDTLATATPLTVGGAPVTAVNELGDFEFFSFHAEAGVPVEFDWLALPSTGTQYTMYDQYGRSLYFLNSAMDVNHFHSFMPTITGTYYLVLEPNVYGAGGPNPTTSFQLTYVVDDYGETLATAGVLTVDGPVVDARHDYTADFDLFAITFATAGTYRFEALPVGLLQYELLAFYDASGHLLEYRVLTNPGEGLTIEIDTPGTFYVGIELLTGLVNSDQRYDLFAYSTTDDVGSTLTTAHQLSLGAPSVTGSINYNEDADWFRFQATAGQVIRIDYTELGGFAARTLTILNDEGLVYTWFNPSPYTPDFYLFEVSQTGTYYISVGTHLADQYNGGTGDYTLALGVLPGESSLPTPLTVGTPIGGNLTSTDNGSDTFVFHAVAGQTIRFNTDAPMFTRLSIFNPLNSTFLVLEHLAYDIPVGYTFETTGNYYLFISGDAGAYSINSQVITDNAGSTLATAAPITINGPAVHGQIDFENDIDWFSFTVEAGDTFYFELTNPSGAYLTTGPTNPLEGLPGNVVRFDTAGTYYYSVEGFYWEETGATYSVTAVTYTGDALRNDVMTTGAMTVGGPAFTDTLNYRSDIDWVAVQLEAGEDYIFTVTGLSTPGNYLNGTIDVFDQNGVEVGSSGFNTGQTTTLIYTANYTGTHYLGVWAQGIAYTSPFTLTANEYTPPLIDTISPGLPRLPDNSFDHEHVGPLNVINLYFAENGDEFGDIISDGWFQDEIDAVMAVLSAFEAALNIDFQITDFMPYADLALTTFNSPTTATTFQRANWDVPIPVIGFSYSSALWTEAALAPGGLGAAYVLNAMGFALGLAFPHEQEGDSYVMEGVHAPTDFGDYNLNQGVYTIMSFNDGWVTSPYGQAASNNYGWQATPMALDIAALQALYGANTTANSGASSYALASTNVAGTGWRSIWDTGGADAITYSGFANAHIDLRAATLGYAAGGAGYLSYVTGIYGGLTIAHGVVIENATSGGGADTIIGNDAANTLSGGDGSDAINGGGGADVINGGNGNDILDGEAGADILDGGEGNDVIMYDAADSASNVQGGGGADILVFTTGGPPVGFDLSSHGFELAEGRYTVTGATFTHYYDGQWRLSHEIGEASSGSSWFIDWDETSSAPYQRLNQDFDATGQLTHEYGLSDNGSTWDQFFDTDGTHPYVSILQVHTAGGVYANEHGINDNGSTWDTFYDVDGTNPFQWVQQVRDANGVLAQEEGLADGGTRWFTDFDETGTTDYVFYQNVYDTLNRLSFQNGEYDTGYTWTIDYDETATQPWTSIRNDYDDRGVLVGTTTIWDGP